MRKGFSAATFLKTFANDVGRRARAIFIDPEKEKLKAAAKERFDHNAAIEARRRAKKERKNAVK